MSMLKYPFQRNSSLITSWASGHPPRPTRGAENVALGGITIIPGGPEPIAGIDSVITAITAHPILAAAGAYLAYRHFVKGKRR